jgi:hypothetical protein
LCIKCLLTFRRRFHGGWLAPNIYFLGHAGCIQVNGIRIAGASGIFKEHDFRYGTCRKPSLSSLIYTFLLSGYWERMPYGESAKRSIYHTREFNIRRLSLVSCTPTCSPIFSLTFDCRSSRRLLSFSPMTGLRVLNISATSLVFSDANPSFAVLSTPETSVLRP